MRQILRGREIGTPRYGQTGEREKRERERKEIEGDRDRGKRDRLSDSKKELPTSNQSNKAFGRKRSDVWEWDRRVKRH